MFSYRISAIAMLAVFGLMVGTVCADAVSVGNSALIGELDYSDTFTLADFGGQAGRVDGGTAGGTQVENCYDNPLRSWPGNPHLNLRTDATAQTTEGNWPGGSGAGSDTGMIQSNKGISSTDFGFEYDLRTVFTVQYDAVFAPFTDRYDITVNTTPSSLAGPNGLSLFIRKPDLGLAEVGLYCPGIALPRERDTGLKTGIEDGWHNLAATFDLDNGLIEVYVDENSIGQIDLKTFEGGVYWNQVNADTNKYVNIGWATRNVTGNTVSMFWIDNFQVGAPGVIPEPSTLALFATGLIGLLAYAWRKRR